MPAAHPPIDVARTRADTPGAAQTIHLNNAGSALPPQIVLDTVIAHLQHEARSGGYEAATLAEERLERVYRSVASLIGAAPDEIALVENATRAWDMAFYAIPFQPGDRILTAQAEYASNVIAFLQVAKRHGVTVEPVADDETGQLSLERLAQMIDDRVKLIAITHVPTHSGLVNPAAAIGAIARRHGILYLLDACQSVGQMPIDVAVIGCDMLSATGRKFLRGPRGTGFLYVRRDLIPQLDPPFLDLHAARWTGRETFQVRADARRFENWESYVAGRLGLGAAADYAMQLGLTAISVRVRQLAERLRSQLAEIPGVHLHDRGTERSAIVTFTKDGHSAKSLAGRLQRHGINVSVSTASSALYDMTARGLKEIVRVSPHYYNIEEELDRLCQVISENGGSASPEK